MSASSAVVAGVALDDLCPWFAEAPGAHVATGMLA